MNTRINPELWNSFSPVQKRAVAENLVIEAPRFLGKIDLVEVAAWTSTIAAAGAVIAFASILLR